jgi:hypothetical protein
MLNIQSNTTLLVANIAAVVVLSLGFVAAGAFSASAENKPAVHGAAQSESSVRRWHRKEFERTYLLKPGYVSPLDTDRVCETAREFCTDYHGSNGG